MLTIKTIATIPPGKTLWDDGKGSVGGFGARRQKGEAVAYILKYRTADGRQRWHTIGRHGAPWTPDLARAEARRLLGDVAKGDDPAAEKQQGRKAATVAQLCDEYLEAAKAGRLLTRRGVMKKPATLDGDRGRIERHIKPLLGNLKVAAVSRQDVERFNNQVSEGATAARVKTGKHGLAIVTGGRGTATRAMGLLGAIFNYAIRQGMRADNPAIGVARHAYAERQRRASDAEYAALGEALRAVTEATERHAALDKALSRRRDTRRSKLSCAPYPSRHGRLRSLRRSFSPSQAGDVARRWRSNGQKSIWRRGRRGSPIQRPARQCAHSLIRPVICCAAFHASARLCFPPRSEPTST